MKLSRWVPTAIVVGLLTIPLAAAAADHCIVRLGDRCFIGNGDHRSPAPERSPSSPAKLPTRDRLKSKLPFDWRPLPELEASLLRRINLERQEAGLGLLTPEPQLADLARAHSERMASKLTVWHNTDFVAWAKTIGAKGLGENVDMNVNPARSHAAFMKSPPHRANILDPRFTHIGVGVFRDREGFVFVTEDFVRLEGWTPPQHPPGPIGPGRGVAQASEDLAAMPGAVPVREPDPPERPSRAWVWVATGVLVIVGLSRFIRLLAPVE